MKSHSQIEQRISHLKEREKDVDVSTEIYTLNGCIKGGKYMTCGQVWDLVEKYAKSNTRIKEIRILLWILED